LDKAERAEKIDGVIALAMAVDAVENAPPPVQSLGWLGAEGFIPADAAA
jgi:hypothetical protein